MALIRAYNPTDYAALKKLYEDSGWFDAETDSEKRILQQVESQPNSILLAIEGDEIVGTVTLLFTERLGLFFRLIGVDPKIRKQLLQRGEEVFKEKGYREVHIIVPEEDKEKQTEYQNFGFKKGKNYVWFWKKI